MDPVKLFEQFLDDDEAWDMYVTGRAGTGKTTDCKHMLAVAYERGIEPIVCAYTHKACNILRQKMPPYVTVTTLHSYLKKRPSVNVNAAHIKHMHSNVQTADPEKRKLIVVDEYSMIGEKDYCDLRALQDEDYDGVAEVKILWLGDPYQLPPVGDRQAVTPDGRYQVLLTEQKRRKEDNPLGAPIDQLVSFIEGEEASKLITSDKFARNKDIIAEYTADACTDKVILCYTNKAVQTANVEIEGRSDPIEGDKLFCPTTQQYYTFEGRMDRNQIDYIDKPFGEPLPRNSKYKTLEHLIKMLDIEFAEVTDADGACCIVAYVFGHYSFNTIKASLSRTAAESNKAIQAQFPNFQPAAWAKANDTHPLARARAKAWRDFLTFDECVHCLDFGHAMTVHKSQGSTFQNVYVDTQDLAQLVDTNWNMYLRLMYVALSRASGKVITN